jgi:ferredoxin/flavodoxin---NADP+ reductase
MAFSGGAMSSDTEKRAVLSIRDLDAGAYVLRIERGELEFEAGQYVHVGPLPGIERREYSVYSSPSENFLEILVKEVPGGSVSPRLRRLEPGEKVDVEGPYGFFRIEPGQEESPHLFLATGTGISPFHCFAAAYPELDYLLVHGVRTVEERYDHGCYPPERVISCVSRGEGGDYSGRVTDWLRENPARSGAQVYLCGNCDMIYEAYDILGGQGVPSDRVHAEVYF